MASVSAAFDVFFDMGARAMLEVPGTGDTPEVLAVVATLNRVEARLRAAGDNPAELARLMQHMRQSSGAETHAWAVAGQLPGWCRAATQQTPTAGL